MARRRRKASPPVGICNDCAWPGVGVRLQACAAGITPENALDLVVFVRARWFERPWIASNDPRVRSIVSLVELLDEALTDAGVDVDAAVEAERLAYGITIGGAA